MSTDTISGYHGTALGALPNITITRAQSELPPLILDGWATVRDGNIFIDESTLITGNVTYYAKWIEIDTGGQGLPGNDKFRVIFAVFNPNENPPQYHYKPGHGNGSIITTSDRILNVPGNNKLSIPDGYNDVNGWYRRYEIDDQGNVLLSDKFDMEHDVVTGNMLLYANPVHDSDRRTVTFNTHGGSGVDEITGYKHCAIAAPAEPAKANAKFGGWYEDENFTQPWHFGIDPLEEDMTLHALWLSSNAHDYLMNDLEEGGAYIDTGIVPTNNTRVVVDFKYNGDRDTMIVGSNSPEFGIKAQHIKKTFEAVYLGQEVSAFGYDYTSRTRSVLDFSVGKGFMVDGAAYGSVASGNLSGSGTICLFKASGDTYATKGKLYSAQIYEGNTLICNLIPYRTDSGVAGLYDTLNGGFYASQSNVQFTVGDD